jgi:hypothetical protein
LKKPVAIAVAVVLSVATGFILGKLWAAKGCRDTVVELQASWVDAKLVGDIQVLHQIKKGQTNDIIEEIEKDMPVTLVLFQRLRQPTKAEVSADYPGVLMALKYLKRNPGTTGNAEANQTVSDMIKSYVD